MIQNIDTIVIGAGIVGVSTALHLQWKGQRVLLLDRRGAGMETSYGNSGILESSYVMPFTPPSWKKIPDILLGRLPAARMGYPSGLTLLPWMLDLYLKSQPAPRRRNGALLRPLLQNTVAEHRHLLQGTGAEKYLSDFGRLKLHRSAASFAAAKPERDIAQEMGVPFDVLDPAQIKDIEPALNPVMHKAVRWTGSARLTNPGAVVAAYAARFVKDGGMFEVAQVEKINPATTGGWQAVTDKGLFQAAQVVIATGPWANALAKPLGYHFPLGMKRGYHQHFATNGASLSHAVVDTDIGYVLVSMEQGIRLTTGAEFARIHAPHRPAQLRQVLPKAQELLPQLGEAIEEKPWLGSRPCFADSLPAIGVAPRHKGLWFNIGHGHSGLTTGPSSGRLVAEMITGEKPGIDPLPYRPDRFGFLTRYLA